MPDREPLGVIGAGWVGLVTATCFAELGHEVWVRDVVAEKIETLSRGEVPIYEPGLPELIQKNAERLHWTLDMGDVVANAELLFCCVDTPPTYSGDADLSRVEKVVSEIGDLESHALVMKSTVPVGTGRSIKRRLEKMGYVSNPEFLKEGSALKQLAGNSGYHFQLLTAVIEVNELQKRRIVGKLQKHLGSLLGKEIALLGVAFKPDTDDVREATSLVLAARLQSEGAQVRVYDPVATQRARELLIGMRICDSALDALDGADGAVLVTEWPEFRELDWAGEVRKRMRNPLIVDGR